MTKENKMKAIELLSKHRCTIQIKPIVNGLVNDEYLGITESCHNAIETLIKNDYILTLGDGIIYVNKINKGE